MAHIKVEGFPGLVKDTRTGIVVNTNTSEIEAAKERKRRKKEQRESQEEINKTVVELKEEIGEIKNLLKQLIEKE